MNLLAICQLDLLMTTLPSVESEVVRQETLHRHSLKIAPSDPYPRPKLFLFRFTLISRMVLGVGKKSEISLKTEDFDP